MYHISLSLYIYIYICMYVYIYIYIYRPLAQGGPACARRRPAGGDASVGPRRVKVREGVFIFLLIVLLVLLLLLLLL